MDAEVALINARLDAAEAAAKRLADREAQKTRLLDEIACVDFVLGRADVAMREAVYALYLKRQFARGAEIADGRGDAAGIKRVPIVARGALLDRRLELSELLKEHLRPADETDGTT